MTADVVAHRKEEEEEDRRIIDVGQRNDGNCDGGVSINS